MNTVTEKLTDALWWIGWRPLAAGSLGAVVGVVAGYSRGGLGPVAAAVGIVVIGLGVFVPTLRRLGFVGSIGAFAAFFLAGPERVRGVLERVGLGPERLEAIAESVLNVGGLVGIETAQGAEATEVVGGGVAALTVWSLAGAVFGGVVWLIGVQYINGRYAGIYQGFTETVEEEGRQVLGDDGSFYSFTHGKETIPLVRSAKEYHATNLLAGDSSLSIHHGMTVDMVDIEEGTSDSTKDLYYDQVASVDYEKPYLKIGMSDGQVVKIVTSEKPVEFMEDMEGRLRRYKSSPTEVDRDETVEADSEQVTVEEDGWTGTVEDTGVSEGTGPEERGTADDKKTETEEAAEAVAETVDEEAVNEGDEGGEDQDSVVDGIAEEVEEVLDEFGEAMGSEGGADEDEILGAFDVTDEDGGSEDAEGETAEEG